jgi:hypothetical protein
MFHDSITVSFLLGFFFNFTNLFRYISNLNFYKYIFQNSNVIIISPFQWLISTKRTTFDIIECTESVFYFNFGFGGGGGGLQAGSPP